MGYTLIEPVLIPVLEATPIPTRHITRLHALAAILDRLAFAALILLALTFAFELPLGSKLAGEATLTTVKILQVTVIGLWLVARGLAWSRPQVPRRLAIPVILWFAVLLISTLLAPAYLSHTIRFMSRVTQGLLLAWIAYDLVNTVKRWRLLIAAFVVAGVAVALFGIAEAIGIPAILDLLLLFRDTQTHVGDVLRISSTLEYATIAAMVLEMLIPLTVAWIVTATQRWLKALLGLGLVAEVLAMVLTLTRSAIAGLAVALIVVAAVSWLRRRHDSLKIGNVKIVVGTMALVLVSVVVLLVVNPTVGLRMLSENENGWYQVRYGVLAQVSARPNERVTIPVQLTNAGLRIWQATVFPPFRLGATLSHVNDKSFTPLDEPRTELPGDVPPGQSVTVSAQVYAPKTPGNYLVQWDMVEETILWFSWRGSLPGTTTLVVAGEPVVSSRVPNLTPANHVNTTPPIERPVLWSTALHMFRDKQLFGVGPDNFRWLYGNYLKLALWDTTIHANSIYFEWLADTGLIGLLAFLWLNWRLMRSAWEGVQRQADPKLWIWQLALFASLITWFVHGVLDNFYEFAGTYVLFWLIAGLAVNAALRHTQTADQPVGEAAR